MITPSFSLTATERVLPKLALDFTTASLDSRITFTRSLNTATVVNSSGLVVPINADLPRFDYNPITLACKGLLIEETRTNLQGFSENFDTSASWGNSGITFSLDAGVAPSDVQNADLITENTANSTHAITSNTTISTGVPYSWSVFVKPNGRTQVSIQGMGLAGQGFGCIFTLTGSGSVSSAPTGSFITAYKNGWYRIAVVATPTNTTPPIIYLYNGGTTYTGDGTSGVYLWGAQLEQAAFPTSYIPTTTTSLTRNADVATMTGTNFSDWFNASEGAFVTKTSSFSTSTANAVIFACHNTDANMIDLYNQVDSQLIGRVRAGGANIAVLPSGTVVDAAFEGYAFAYKSGSIGLANKGAVPITSAATYSFASSPSTLAIGANQIGTQQMNGHFAKLFYYPQRITNAETQAFSK